MQKISPSDSLFLDLETPNTPMTIGGINIVDRATAAKDFDIKRDVRSHIEKRLHLSPNLRRKLVYHPLNLEEPRLVDASDFDLDYHIRYETLASPNDWKTLTALVSKIIATPMDMKKPLWEFHVIDGLTNIKGIPDTAYAFVTKFHHSVFDGGSAGVTMWQFMQDAPGDTVAPPTEMWQPEKDPEWYDWTVSAMVENTKMWGKGFEAMQGFTAGIISAMTRLKADKPESKPQNLTAPQMRFSQALSTERTWDSISFPMNELLRLRMALGKPKMNDLFMTIIAGGMRRYLQKTNELPDDPVLSICPISVRDNNPLEGGNYLSSMRVPLFTNIADPIERLTEISKSSFSAKDTVHTLGKDFAAHVLGVTPYATRKNLIGGLHALPNKIDVPTPPLLANVVISNAPPPKGGHYFADCKVITSPAYGPVFNFIGVIHAVTGMDFESTIGVTACKKILPDIEFYMDCIRESFKEIQSIAGVGNEKADGGSPKAEPAAKKKPAAKKTAPKKARTRSTAAKKAASKQDNTTQETVKSNSSPK